MKLIDSYVDVGDTVEIGDVQTKRLEIDSVNPRFVAIYTGDTDRYTVNKKRIDDSHSDFNLPKGSVVLGIKPNANVNNSFVWYGIPESQYSFDIGVSQ